MSKFILQQDNCCHWYIIPAEKEADWNQWLGIPEGDERSWEVPDYAQQVGGSYTLVTFENPVVRN